MSYYVRLVSLPLHASWVNTHVVVQIGLEDVTRYMHVGAVVVIVDVQVGVVVAQTPRLVRYPVRLGPLVSQVCTHSKCVQKRAGCRTGGAVNVAAPEDPTTCHATPTVSIIPV